MLIIHLPSIFRRDHSEFDCHRTYFQNIDARAIVRDDDFDLVCTFGADGDRDGRPHRFPSCFALLRSLDTVIDAVSHQMNQGIFHLLQNSPIGLDLTARDCQIRVLTAVPAKVPHKFGEGFEERGKGDHGDALHVFDKIVHSSVQD